MSGIAHRLGHSCAIALVVMLAGAGGAVAASRQHAAAPKVAWKVSGAFPYTTVFYPFGPGVLVGVGETTRNDPKTTHVFGIDEATGKLLWQTATPLEAKPKKVSQVATGISEDTLYLQSSANLLSFDMATHKVVWKRLTSMTRDVAYGSLGVTANPDFVSTGLTLFDAHTGKLVRHAAGSIGAYSLSIGDVIATWSSANLATVSNDKTGKVLASGVTPSQFSDRYLFQHGCHATNQEIPDEQACTFYGPGHRTRLWLYAGSYVVGGPYQDHPTDAPLQFRRFAGKESTLATTQPDEASSKLFATWKPPEAGRIAYADTNFLLYAHDDPKSTDEMKVHWYGVRVPN